MRRKIIRWISALVLAWFMVEAGVIAHAYWKHTPPTTDIEAMQLLSRKLYP